MFSEQLKVKMVIVINLKKCFILKVAFTFEIY
jgi:hypothetical protein